MNIIYSYNESYLYKVSDTHRISFEGDLDEIATGLYLDIGKSLIDSSSTYNKIGDSQLGISALTKYVHLIVYDYPTYFSIGTNKNDYAEPLFLGLLNQKYQEVFDKYNKLKSFW